LEVPHRTPASLLPRRPRTAALRLVSSAVTKRLQHSPSQPPQPNTSERRSDCHGEPPDIAGDCEFLDFTRDMRCASCDTNKTPQTVARRGPKWLVSQNEESTGNMDTMASKRAVETDACTGLARRVRFRWKWSDIGNRAALETAPLETERHWKQGGDIGNRARSEIQQDRRSGDIRKPRENKDGPATSGKQGRGFRGLPPAMPAGSGVD
jgi:hypothetical protein